MTQQEWIEQQRKLLDPQKQANLAASAGIYDAQRQNTQALYQGQIADTTAAYEDALRSNETQKFLNQRAIERRMAEMGLTDSGLNRTQQTAVMLSAANNRGAIERQRQKAVDTLAATMASELATIDANKAAAAQDITNTFENNAYSQGTTLYNNEQPNVAAENASRIKAETEGKQLIYTSLGADKDGGVVAKDKKGNWVFSGKYQYRDEKGNVISVDTGINPYTQNNNRNAQSVKKYGVFSNTPYQPKGIISVDGYDYGGLTNTGKTTTVTGKSQRVWESTDKNGNTYKWLWSGKDNGYLMVDYDKNGELMPVTDKYGNDILITVA